MKNKSHIRTLAVTLAVMFSMAAFSTVAYAGGDDTDYNDGVNQEPMPEVSYVPQPLTPEGNLTIVDDIEGEASEDKQFITVVSKNGNYFYIIVDRAAEGENTVHFLNLVDEADLLALMEDGQSQTVVTPTVCSCTDKCVAGAGNISCDLCKTDMTNCMGKEVAADTEPETESKSSSPLPILLVLMLLGGGGAFYYLKVMKPKQSTKGSTNLDDLDYEDDFEETELEVFEDEETEDEE